MATVQVNYGLDKVFDIDIEVLWAVLAKFESMSFFGFDDTKVKGRGELGKPGYTRIFLMNGVESEETIEGIDHERKTLTYTCTIAGPPFNGSYISTVKLDEVGEKKCRVRWWASMQVKKEEEEEKAKAMAGCPVFFTSCIEKVIQAQQ